MQQLVNQYFWNLFFVATYVVLVFTGIKFLENNSYISYLTLDLLDITLLSLATFCLIRLFVYDKIFQFFRNLFFNVEMMNGEIVLAKPVLGPRRAVADIIVCPWCSGVLIASILVFFYLFSPGTHIVVLILAVAGVGGFLQLVARLVGLKMEDTKNQVNHRWPY